MFAQILQRLATNWSDTVPSNLEAEALEIIQKANPHSPVPAAIEKAAWTDAIRKAVYEILSRSGAATVGPLHNKGPPPLGQIYNIQEFCAVYRLSRALLCKMWKNNAGPKYFKVGASVRISQEAAEAWRRGLEQATPERHAFRK